MGGKTQVNECNKMCIQGFNLILALICNLFADLRNLHKICFYLRTLFFSRNFNFIFFFFFSMTNCSKSQALQL